MKMLPIMLGLALIFPISALAELHTFRLPDGRTVDAEIISVDEQRGKVELRREDGKIVKVNLGIFIQEDQQRIQDWAVDYAFLSPRALKVNLKKQILNKWKEDFYRDYVYDGGGGETETMLEKETRYEEIAFNITVKSALKVDIEELVVDYIIYYEQSLEAWNKTDMKQHRKSGSITLLTLSPGKAFETQSESVVIHNDSLDSKRWASGRHKVEGKGDVHGIRLRISKKIDGQIVYQEYAEPSSLSLAKFPWIDEG